MWIFRNDAFVSAVQHESDPACIMLRARVAGDLSRFLGHAVEEIETPRADYRFRTIVRKEDFAAVLAASVQGINYFNFKDSVRAKDRSMRYLEVWHAMYDFQNDRAPPVEATLNDLPPLPLPRLRVDQSKLNPEVLAQSRRARRKARKRKKS